MYIFGGGAPLRGRARRRTRAGLTILEVVIGVALLVTGVLGYLHVVAEAMATAEANAERALATEAARQRIEEMKSRPLGQVLALFDDDPANDPGGAGTAPGGTFTVPGLAARTDAVDGAVGRTLFPLAGAALREDIVDLGLGMPRDLDGDGVVDALDKSGDYVLLPVRVRVEWRGAAGNAFVELRTVLGGP
jgi:hypothetical protein